MIVDGEKGVLEMANAGHPRPLLVSKAQDSATPLMDPEETGIAIGFVGNPCYQTCQYQLDPGDIVLGFTDGAYEVRNDRGEMFGLSRLQDLVGSNVHLVPRDLIQRIISETDEFMASARRPDDLCVVSAELE
jgi:sigma-B regulation protein RsbU (phosphoserine phosphatase)